MKNQLTIIPALEFSQESIVLQFETEQEMDAASDAVANTLLFMQDKLQVMDDYSNVFIKEQLVDGEWEEIETDTEESTIRLLGL